MTVSPTDEVRALWNSADLPPHMRHDEEDFSGWGASIIAKLGPLASRITEASTALEWGSGGGAIVRAFPACNYHAVDISERSRAASARSGAITMDPSEVRGRLADSSVDCFISTACFQHFPSRSYGVEVVRLARKLLKPGGFGLIQTRYPSADNAREYDAIPGAYAEHYTDSAEWWVDEFWGVLEAEGFAPIAVSFDESPRFAFYVFGG